MIASVELQVISKLLTNASDKETTELLKYDSSYYSVFQSEFQFIYNHYQQYHNIPDVFTFTAQFPEVTLVSVTESIEYLTVGLQKNKQRIMLLDMFNKIKDLNSDDADTAWNYISEQCTKALELTAAKPMDIVHQAKERCQQIVEFNKKARIPTGFKEIDNVMYGGLSTVEELAIVFARTNTGKSWVCTKMMESAQKNGFPVLYYSPEMQASFLATRFDTWRKQFRNGDLHQGKYSQEYIEYINDLEKDPTPAYVLEDKDAAGGAVNVPVIQSFVKSHNIKLVIIDGLSYMEDARRTDTDYVKYKNICADLFKMSKQCGCAVVVAMQANRETRNNTNVSEGGKEPWPNLYNLEGSDHPARISTQAFALRQVYDQQILDIKMEKSRNAANQKPVFSYSWDPNTGNMQLIDDVDSSENIQYQVTQDTFNNSTINSEYELDSGDDDIEF